MIPTIDPRIVCVKRPFLYYSLCLLIWVSSRPLQAQTTAERKIDSLKQVLSSAVADTIKVKAYKRIISRYYDQYTMMGGKVADSIAYFKMTEGLRTLSKKINQPEGVGYSFLREAAMYAVMNKPGLSYDKWRQSLAIYQYIHDTAGLSHVYYIRAGILLPRNDSTDLKLIYLDTALRYARKFGEGQVEIWGLQVIANIYLAQGKQAEAIEALVRVMDLHQYWEKKGIVRTSDQLAHVYAASGNHQAALRQAVTTLEHCRRLNDTSQIATYYNRLAHLYSDVGNYERALDYYQKALKVLSDQQVIAATLYSTTNCLIVQQRYPEGLRMLAEYEKKYLFNDYYAVFCINKSYLSIYIAMKRYAKAIPHLNQVLKDTTQSQFDIFEKASVFGAAGDVYFHTGQLHKAVWYSERSYELAGYTKSLPFRQRCSYRLYQIDSAQGNFAAALRHYKEYHTYTDSIQRDVAGKHTKELAVQYETQQKNIELANFAAQAKLKDKTILQGKELRNAMIAISALLLMLATLAFGRYQAKQKANRLLQIKQEEINRQNEELARMVEAEKKITTEKEKLLTEKEWLLKEINHRVKNNLQIVMSLLETQGGYLRDEAALKAISVSQHRVQAIALIHKKLYQRDEVTTAIEMSPYIEELTEYLRDGLDVGPSIRTDLFVDAIALDVAQAVPVGLIINEAFTNAVKYAFPVFEQGNITIRMKKNGSVGTNQETEILLTIMDNGIGLPVNLNWQHTDSLGIRLMKGLTEQIDGEFLIVNNDGTTIQIKFRCR